MPKAWEPNTFWEYDGQYATVVEHLCRGYCHFFHCHFRPQPTFELTSLQGRSPQSCTVTDFEMKTSNFVLFLLISVVSVHFRAIYDETIRCLSSLENFSFNSILVFVFVIMEDFLKSHKEWIQYQRKPLCVSWSSTLMTIKNHDFQQLDIHYVLYGSFGFLYRFNQS